jgi:hypothetical protein
MIEIKLEDAKRLLALAVDEMGGDYVYPYESCTNAVNGDDCLYFHDDHIPVDSEEGCAHFDEPTALCIFAKAMVHAGVSPAELVNVGGTAVSSLETLENAGIAKATPLAAWYLREAQVHQDYRKTWSYAKTAADLWLVRGAKVSPQETAETGVVNKTPKDEFENE